MWSITDNYKLVITKTITTEVGLATEAELEHEACGCWELAKTGADSVKQVLGTCENGVWALVG